MLRRELHGIDHPQNLIEVAARGHGIDQQQLDPLVRPDDEDVAHRGVVGGGAAFRTAFGVGGQHAVQFGNLQVGVADHGIVGTHALGLLDIVRPFGVVLHRIDRQPQHLDAALVEFRLQLGDGAQLGGADRREILGVREEQHPIVACPIIKVQRPLGGGGGEIGGDVVDRKRHGISSGNMAGGT